MRPSLQLALLFSRASGQAGLGVFCVLPHLDAGAGVLPADAAVRLAPGVFEPGQLVHRELVPDVALRAVAVARAGVFEPAGGDDLLQVPTAVTADEMGPHGRGGRRPRVRRADGDFVLVEVPVRCNCRHYSRRGRAGTDAGVVRSDVRLAVA